MFGAVGSGEGADVKACTVTPGKPESAKVEEVPEPPPDLGEIHVEGQLVGVCGTDVEITQYGYGWPPPGSDRMTLFHESLGRVIDAPKGSGFATGDLVVGIVRRPDPVPCMPCSKDEWDFCRNGKYTERGIKEMDGYGSQQWRVPAKFAVRLDADLGDLAVLTEPTSVVAKAWDQVEKISARATLDAHRVLVTGAGPIGLLAAMIGVQKGYEVHVLDRVTDGPKPQLVRDLGATYHSDAADAGEPDVVIECTGVGQLVFDLLQRTAHNAITCLTGISSGTRAISTEADALNKELVLGNDVVFGSVNANRRHYDLAGAALAKADAAWLRRLISRRVPLADFATGLDRRKEDIKVVLDLTS